MICCCLYIMSFSIFFIKNEINKMKLIPLISHKKNAYSFKWWCPILSNSSLLWHNLLILYILLLIEMVVQIIINIGLGLTNFANLAAHNVDFSFFSSETTDSLFPEGRHRISQIQINILWLTSTLPAWTVPRKSLPDKYMYIYEYSTLLFLYKD